jgi:hypothetical protein
MSCPNRRLTLSAILVAGALALAAPPVQAGEILPAGWFGTLAHQVTQWTAGWWSWPAKSANDQPVERRAEPVSLRPQGGTDCGGTVDPTGGCKPSAVRRN